MTWPGRDIRDQISIYGTAIALSALAVAAAIWWIEPAPPGTIRMATGAPGGVYENWGEQYRSVLGEIGIEVDLIPSAGALDNLELLQSGRADVAFLQSGLPAAAEAATVEALASLAPEPAWIFTRDGVSTLRGIEGRRIAGGAEGSGTLAFSRRLVEIAGLGEKTEIVALGGDDAAGVVEAGEVDGAIFISAVANPRIERLLRAPDMKLVSVADATGLTRRNPWLTDATLVAGAIDYRDRIPALPLTLLSTTALLAANSDLHPAFVDVLLGAASTIHGEVGLFAAPGEYPKPPLTALDVNEDAMRYFEEGPTFLRRYLPFWVASFVERAWVLVLPLLTVMFPLFRIAPPTYRWRINRRINRYYLKLKKIEVALERQPTGEKAGELAREIDALADAAARTPVPPGFMSDLYHLRRHIAIVRERIEGVMSVAR